MHTDIQILTLHLIGVCFHSNISLHNIGNFLLVPQIGIASDTVAIEQLKEIYRDCEVVPCEAKGIVAKGGAFNCVSWNIKE